MFGAIEVAQCPNAACTTQYDDYACTIAQVIGTSDFLADISIVVNAIDVDGTTSVIDHVTIERYDDETDEPELDYAPDLGDAPDLEDAPQRKVNYWHQDAYQNQSRYDKLEQLWEELIPNPHDRDVEPLDFMWRAFPKFFTRENYKVFRSKSDALPAPRQKLVHTQGLVAKVRWIPVANDEGYSGIYETGSDTMILRLS